MDEADKAARSMEFIEKANLYHSHRNEPVAVAIGECLYCGAPFYPSQDKPGSPVRRWCDAECRDDWEGQ